MLDRDGARPPGNGHVVTEAAAAGEAPPRLNPLFVAALQRSVGNRAVRTLITARPSVQRTPVWLATGNPDPRMVQFAEAVERRVLSAYGFLMANPSLGAHATLATKDKDGYIGNWLTHWRHQGAGPHPWSLFHAQAGYAIESLATFLALTDAPQGTYADAQVTYGSTRPDLVLYDATNHQTLGWLDITAKRSVGHVEKKAGPWIDLKNAEILYPSFTDSDFTVMQQNDSRVDKPTNMGENVRLLMALGMTRNLIEEEEAQKRVQYFLANPVAALKTKLAEQWLSSSQKRKLVVDYFQANLDPSLTTQPIADMLYAANQSVGTFFPKTTSQKVPTGLSKRNGHAWLADCAESRGWTDVTLSNGRKRQIRLDVETELFGNSTRTLTQALDLEAGLNRGQKRRALDEIGPPLKRAKSAL